MQYAEPLQEHPPSIIFDVEEMVLQYEHNVEDFVDGEKQAAPELEPEQDKDIDLDVEAAEEQGQDSGPV